MAKDEATLEAELAEAKEAYRSNPDDQELKAQLSDAKKALIDVRRERRSAGVTVGGDAFVSNGSEG